jgi:hypothetical protein
LVRRSQSRQPTFTRIPVAKDFLNFIDEDKKPVIRAFDELRHRLPKPGDGLSLFDRHNLVDGNSAPNIAKRIKESLIKDFDVLGFRARRSHSLQIDGDHSVRRTAWLFAISDNWRRRKHAF